MKNTISIITIFIVLFFLVQSCEPRITFEEPQPTGFGSLSKFPSILVGNYLNIDDSSILSISKEAIEKTTKIDIKEPKKVIDTTKGCEIIGDTLYYRPEHIKCKITIVNDTVYGTTSYKEFLFQISDEEVLKKFKGHFFLNKKYGEKKWGVEMMDYEKNGRLTFYKFEGVVDSLKQITDVEEMKSDSGKTSNYKLHPSRREFKKIIEKQNFKGSDVYQKIE